MCHTWQRWDIYKIFWSENLKGTDSSEETGVDGKILLERILDESGGKVWTGYI
jgi:hypothetical protein